MIEPRGGLSLGFEPLAIGATGELAAEDHLHGHFAAQADLRGAIDDSHAAAAQLFGQLIIAESRGKLKRVAGKVVGDRVRWLNERRATAGGPGDDDYAPELAQVAGKRRMIPALDFQIDGFAALHAIGEL